MARILITGVRGKTGAPLAWLLADVADVEVLGGSSDPSTVAIDGVRPTAFSWDDPSGWPAATEDVDAVYVMRPDRADERSWRDQIAAGQLPFSSGGARVASIDTRDIAAVAQHALLDEGHAGRTHELSGPEALTLPEAAHQLSGALGRPVTHVETTVEDSVPDLDGFDRDLFVTTRERVHAGSTPRSPTPSSA